MALTDIVKGAAIGIGIGAFAALMGSSIAGNYSARQKIQQRFGITVQGDITDMDAAGDFLYDHGMKFIYAGAVIGLVGGAVARKRRYY